MGMKVKRVSNITAVILLLFSLSAWAQDKIILKNGNIIECRIIEYKPEGVMIDITGGNVANITVNKNDIVQIIVPPPLELKRAEDYFAKKNYSQAVAQYKAVLAKYHNFSYSWKEDVYFNLAYSYMEEKKWAEAKDTFNKILSEFKSPKSVQKAQLGLAEVLFSKKDFSGAKKAYTEIIKTYSKEKETLAHAHYYLGECIASLGEHEKALISFLKVEIFYYDYPALVVKAKFRSGEMAEVLKDWQRAKWTYEELIDDFPDSIYARRAEEKLVSIKERR